MSKRYSAKDSTEAEAIIEAKKEAGISNKEDVAGEREISKQAKESEPKVETMCNQCQKEFKSTKEVQDHIEAVHAPERRG